MGSPGRNCCGLANHPGCFESRFDWFETEFLWISRELEIYAGEEPEAEQRNLQPASKASLASVFKGLRASGEIFLRLHLIGIVV